MQDLLNMFKQYEVDWTLVLAIWLGVEQVLAAIGKKDENNSSFQVITSVIKAMASKGKVVAVLVVACLGLMASGCVATTPIDQVKAAIELPTIDPIPAEVEAAGVGNFLIKALDKFKNNPLFTLAIEDSKRTLAKVDTWQGRISESDMYDAKACPTRILLAANNLDARIERYKALIQSIDVFNSGLLDGTFTGVILPLTIRKWGPTEEAGADPKAELEAIKISILNDVNGVRRACENIIPDKEIVRLMKEAAAAGIK